MISTDLQMSVPAIRRRLKAKITGTLGTPPNPIAYSQIYGFDRLLPSDAANVDGYFEAPEIEPLIRPAVSLVDRPGALNEGSSTVVVQTPGSVEPATRLYANATKILHGRLLAATPTPAVMRDTWPRS